MTRRLFARLGLTAALVLGVVGVSPGPAAAYWDCIDYGGYIDCQWYEDTPYEGPYWWECWTPWECSPCNPCWA